MFQNLLLYLPILHAPITAFSSINVIEYKVFMFTFQKSISPAIEEKITEICSSIFEIPFCSHMIYEYCPCTKAAKTASGNEMSRNF